VDHLCEAALFINYALRKLVASLAQAFFFCENIFIFFLLFFSEKK